MTQLMTFTITEETFSHDKDTMNLFGTIATIEHNVEFEYYNITLPNPHGKGTPLLNVDEDEFQQFIQSMEWNLEELKVNPEAKYDIEEEIKAYFTVHTLER